MTHQRSGHVCCVVVNHSRPAENVSGRRATTPFEPLRLAVIMVVDDEQSQRGHQDQHDPHEWIGPYQWEHYLAIHEVTQSILRGSARIRRLD